MMEEAMFEVGPLLGHAWALTVANWRRVAIALLILCVPGVLIDVYAKDQAVNSIMGFVSIFMQFWCTAGLLEDLNRRAPEAGGFVSVFVVGLFSTVAILIGLVLLIIPGVILLVRWSIAVPIVVSEGGGASSALGESWERTSEGFWPILGVLALTYIPVAAIVALSAGAFLPLPPVAESIIENLTSNAIFVFGWHVAISIYLAVTPRVHSLEEVFA